MLHILIDADGCPVKDEVYRVAARYGLPVTVVANTWMHVPAHERIERVVVSGAPEAADDCIAERVAADDIVVTNDIPLAARALAKGAHALNPRGRVFTEESIADALASREVKAFLRELGTIGGGPPPFAPSDRSRFLQRLDEVIQRVRNRRRAGPP